MKILRLVTTRRKNEDKASARGEGFVARLDKDAGDLRDTPVRERSVKALAS